MVCFNSGMDTRLAGKMLLDRELGELTVADLVCDSRMAAREAELNRKLEESVKAQTLVKQAYEHVARVA